MDMDNLNDDLEFSLDDILKEFHDESNGPLILEEDLAVPETPAEEPEEAVTDDTVTFTPAEEAPAEVEEVSVTGDHISCCCGSHCRN